MKQQLENNQKVVEKDNHELIVEKYTKRNNQVLNNQKSTHPTVLAVNEISGLSLITDTIFQFLKLFLIYKNIK